MPAADAGATARGLSGGHLFAGGGDFAHARAAVHAPPAGGLHRAGRHAPGRGGRPAPWRAPVHGPADPRSARQHPDAAHGGRAPAARRFSERADGAGHAAVDRAGHRAGAVGARLPAPPAGRGRAGAGAGVSQGDGGLARHRPARARSGRHHHLRQPGVLRHGGLQRAGVDRPAHARALLAARERARVPPPPGHSPRGRNAAA